MDFIQITVIDVIDIVVVATIMYYLYKVTKGTHTPSILTGILLIYLLWVVVKALNMELLSAILGHIIGVGVIALIVVFQPEIRRFLHLIGTRSNQHRDSFLGRLFDMHEYHNDHLEYVSPIVKACGDMSDTKTGALIVIQQKSDLSVIAETGISIDARISSSLLKNIFFKNSPLHDGAVIINDGRIVAAKCVLPSTQQEVPVSYGMRHRAALGVSEVCDALVVVVSEETGHISVARNGEMHSNLSTAQLQAELLKSAA
ncbi:diadenylate cyclase CdaA [Gallalistipes aquisgranensis]|uniref:diadenylate cyclase CdaA n=1 Tax=Gallalistipes aquisgranensis TaxID=2779358 RepID=UPI001CF808CE|nr:diadenylate cyclase CdaA [Gallalistipes aquisgranensis]MBE5033741.1 TIGR00159 family protein [Gallalistipes aquisgranensis]